MARCVTCGAFYAAAPTCPNCGARAPIAFAPPTLQPQAGASKIQLTMILAIALALGFGALTALMFANYWFFSCKDLDPDGIECQSSRSDSARFEAWVVWPVPPLIVGVCILFLVRFFRNWNLRPDAHD
jgi:hypothetical protein